MKFLATMMAAVAGFSTAVGAEPSAVSVWHVAGGNDRFRAFVTELADGATVRCYADPHEVVFDGGTNDVYFLLPAYARGEMTFPDWDVAGGERLRSAMKRGAGFYFENLVTPDFAQDGLHAEH